MSSGHQQVSGNINPFNVNRNTRYGRTPLSWAAGYGHEEVVRMLLERNDVNPNTADKDGQTPLSWATRKGHGAVVRLLLEQDNANPDTADDEYGQIPPHGPPGTGMQGHEDAPGAERR